MPNDQPPWVLTSVPEPVTPRLRPRVSGIVVFLLGIIVGAAVDAAFLRGVPWLEDLGRPVGLKPASPVPEQDHAAVNVDAPPPADAGTDGSVSDQRDKPQAAARQPRRRSKAPRPVPSE